MELFQMFIGAVAIFALLCAYLYFRDKEQSDDTSFHRDRLVGAKGGEVRRETDDDEE